MRVKVTSEFYDKVLKTYQKEDSVLDVPESRGMVLCKAGVAVEVKPDKAEKTDKSQTK